MVGLMSYPVSSGRQCRFSCLQSGVVGDAQTPIRTEAINLALLKITFNNYQEMIQHWEMDDAFYGFTGNWIMQ